MHHTSILLCFCSILLVFASYSVLLYTLQPVFYLFLFRAHSLHLSSVCILLAQALYSISIVRAILFYCLRILPALYSICTKCELLLYCFFSILIVFTSTKLCSICILLVRVPFSCILWAILFSLYFMGACVPFYLYFMDTCSIFLSVSFWHLSKVYFTGTDVLVALVFYSICILPALAFCSVCIYRHFYFIPSHSHQMESSLIFSSGSPFSFQYMSMVREPSLSQADWKLVTLRVG